MKRVSIRPATKSGCASERLQEGDVGLDPGDAELGERARELRRGDGEIRRGVWTMTLAISELNATPVR